MGFKRIQAGLCVGGVLLLGACNNATVYNGRSYAVQSEIETDREHLIGVIREVLTDHRFEIDRVDARRGVVTTAYKTTQGLASPWDGEQGSFKQETADLVNQHERAVRVDIEDDGSVIVSVLVQRVHRPAWRIETESISRSTHAVVIDSRGNRQPARIVTPIGQDGLLAERIGEAIRSKLVSG
jgi:hypothetical protein